MATSAPRPPTHTERFQPAQFTVPRGARAVFALDPTEDRGAINTFNKLRKERSDDCVLVERYTADSVVLAADGKEEVQLRDDDRLRATLGDGQIYLDISGLPHHVWAPLVRALLLSECDTKVVYAEPKEYRAHPSPTSPGMFDLTTGFGGMAPLPGFAQLLGPSEDSPSLLIAQLGFEGSRPQALAFEFDPVPKVVPIVGVPGYRLEYPGHTISCNREFLDDHGAFPNIMYAKASCPFEAYQAISDAHKAYKDHYLYLAPVGTKPHALGAIAYAIRHPANTEIIYDHPVRKHGRTRGVGVIHVYDLSQFVDD